MQRLEDIKFFDSLCEPDKGAPANKETPLAKHKMVNRNDLASLSDVFVASTKLVKHSHKLFHYDVSKIAITIFDKIHYMRLGMRKILHSI